MKTPIQFRIATNNITDMYLKAGLEIKAMCLEKFLFLISGGCEAVVLLHASQLEGTLRTCVNILSSDSNFRQLIIDELERNNTWLQLSHINCDCNITAGNYAHQSKT